MREILPRTSAEQLEYFRLKKPGSELKAKCSLGMAQTTQRWLAYRLVGRSVSRPAARMAGDDGIVTSRTMRGRSRSACAGTSLPATGVSPSAAREEANGNCAEGCKGDHGRRRAVAAAAPGAGSRRRIEQHPPAPVLHHRFFRLVLEHGRRRCCRRA